MAVDHHGRRIVDGPGSRDGDRRASADPAIRPGVRTGDDRRVGARPNRSFTEEGLSAISRDRPASCKFSGRSTYRRRDDLSIARTSLDQG
jgi:hypothetical protein